jgi:hypothetical protein
VNARHLAAAVLTGTMTVVSMLGSVTGLVAFAAKGQAHIVTIPGVNVDIPLGMWAFVAALDGLAIVLALQVHDGGRIDPYAAAVLATVTASSAVLQFLAAPPVWEAKVVYTAPVPMAAVGTAMFFRGLHRARAEARAAAHARAAEEAEAARREEASSRRAARTKDTRTASGPDTLPVRPPAPPDTASPSGPDTTPDTPDAAVVSSGDIVEDARSVRDRARADGQQLSFRTMKAALEAYGWTVSKDKAGALMKQVEAEPPHLEVVEGVR